MYSRDIFPKYPPARLSVPGNYSGNTFRPRAVSPTEGSPAEITSPTETNFPPVADLSETAPDASFSDVPKKEQEGQEKTTDRPTAPSQEKARETVSSPDDGAPEASERQENESATAQTCADTEKSPLSRLPLFSNPALASFLPPKPDLTRLFGSFGLEELILLGLILLLSGTDRDDDTLLLLALLFLYK